MKPRTRSPAPSAGKSVQPNRHLLINAYAAIGLDSPGTWKRLSKKELNIIKNALSQADKVRLAAYDPGAAYLSGVLDVLTSMRAPTTVKIKKLSRENDPTH